MNKLIELRKIGSNDGGELSVFESNREIPFEIKRVYYTYNVPVNTKRGMHAHKKLKQAIWCPFGNIEIILDDGRRRENFLLDSPEKLLLVEPGTWRDIYWLKEGSVLCIAASDYYSEDDYIRDYGEFLGHVEGGYWANDN